VIDAHGHELPERQEGRLEIKGPSCTRGYHRNPGKTAALFHGDWLDTGDRAYIAEGEVYLVGRVKDMVIRGGRNIFPDELEQAAGKVDGVRKGCVAVFGNPDPSSGTERLIVLAETREKAPEAREQLRARIGDAVFDVLGMPADEIVLAPLRMVLKTSSGKIRRAATRERYLRGMATGGERAVWLQIVRLAWAAVGPGCRRAGHAVVEWLFALYLWMLMGVFAPLAWLTAVILPRPAWSWSAAGALARVFLRLGTRSFTVEGLEHVPGQPCVLVIDHASYLDGIVIVAAFRRRPFSFVAKQELRDRFVPRVFLEHIGAQFVERFDPQRGTEDARRLTELVTSGHSLAFFPEGTFTRVPGLRPFRLGAFVAATVANAPVVPVSLRGTRAILRGDDWFARRGAISVTIGEPILPDGSDWASAIRLRDAAREEILRHCGEPDLA
jgi:1-acyl-sn-glycerol-3-phosphate acyltransferase